MSSSPFEKLSREQESLLDSHLQGATRVNRNCASLRDPLEFKYLKGVVEKLYATLDLAAPTIYLLDSPLACAYAWGFTPQSVADRWRLFHDEFYTHPLHCPIIDMITDHFSAFTRMVGGTISQNMHHSGISKWEAGYNDLDRVGDTIATALTSIPNPMGNTEYVDMFSKQVEANIPDTAIRAAVAKQKPSLKLEKLFLPSEIFRGQHYTKTSYYQAMADLGMPFLGFHKNLISLWEQMNKACHWWFPFRNTLILSDRHSTLHVDERGRPHNTQGPAVEYRDGWKLYAWKGIMVPEQIIEQPETITAKGILKENNTEIRRAMVDIIGIEKFIVDSKGKTLDEQGEYELLEVPYLDGGQMIALKMRCPTTSAIYVHTVHPNCTNVEQALAWKRGEDDFAKARPYREGLLWEK
jgi:hypothetical protein